MSQAISNPGDITFSGNADTGFYTVSDSEAAKFTITINASANDLWSAILEGKDLEANKTEFLDIIARLPFVNGDNLKAMEVYARFKKLVTAIGV